MHANVRLKVVPFIAAVPKLTCTRCNVRELCLPFGLSDYDTARLDTLIGGGRRVKSGQHLYKAGDRFRSLFAIKSGFFKTCVLAGDGRQHVTGFQMHSEILGMDGISTELYACQAVALEDSEVCVIPFAELEWLSAEIQALQHHLHRVMGREIVRDHHVMTLISTKHAEERLAVFLLDLSKRFSARGFSPTDFHLRMSREEIGSYLGLALQTVSRVFSRLQDDNLISVQSKHVRILDLPKLTSCSRPAAGSCPVRRVT